MKKRTREQVIETLEEAIEKKGRHLQSMVFTSKELQKIKDEVMDKSDKDECIAECEFIRKMDRLKLEALDIKIDTLKI